MKKRLDQLLIEKGLIETRNKAQAVIMAGSVFIDGKNIDKAGTMIDVEAEIIVEQPFPYVSRGALKLEKAVSEFGLDFRNKVVCDIGSSTGGFTDFSLQNGAKKVFAIDVGTGQLAQKIREDERVVVMEKTDFRDLIFCDTSELKPCHSCERENQEALTGKCIVNSIDIFVCDVSFISLKKIIPKIAELINISRRSQSGTVAEEDKSVKELIRNSKPDTQYSTIEAILLIKPQFEVGRKEASRGKGVITDPDLHNKVIQEIQDCALDNNFKIKGIVPSPITGAKGNKEFLLYITK